MLDNDAVFAGHNGKRLQLVLETTHHSAFPFLHSTRVAEIVKGWVSKSQLHKRRLVDVDVSDSDHISGEGSKFLHDLECIDLITNTHRGM